MSKRNPTSELNHDNWDADVEKEDAGHFKVASDDTIKKREIRVAKRRTAGGDDKGTGGLFKSFTGFAGFGNAAPSTGFAFGNQQEQQQQSSNISSNNNNSNGTASSTNAKHLAQLKALNVSVLNWIKQHVTDNAYCVLTPIFRDYERHLASIEEKYPFNESDDNASTPAAVASSATTAGSSAAAGMAQFKFSANSSPNTKATPNNNSSNNNSNTPVEASQSPAQAKSSLSSTPTDGNAALPTSTTSNSATFNFTSSALPAAAAPKVGSGPSPPKINFANSNNIGNFQFNAKPPTADEQQPKQQQQSALFGFSFGAASGTTTAAAAADGSSKPAFSFAVGQQQQQQQDEEEYEPPKPETREIKEAGAVYTKRCKLFYMQPDTKQWRDKGVGNVHIKPTDADNKVQLIVRADNNLGTILLNTLVNKEMKLTVTKNNLNFACVPNPPLSGSEAKSDEPKLVPFLIKVKTEDDVNEMLKSIDSARGAD